MKRPRIFAVHYGVTQFRLVSGDQINETRLYRVLSQFADVYYNGQLFDPTADNFGLDGRPIEVPTEPYDLYYVRNNPELFLQLPHPKISLALPYDRRVFEAADAISVQSNAWKRMLKPHAGDASKAAAWGHEWLPKDFVPPKDVIVLEQSADPNFDESVNRTKVFKYRVRFGYGFTVGVFGRLERDCYPKMYLDALPELERRIPKLATIFAGNIRVPLPKTVRNVGRIPHEDMPAAYAASDLLLYDMNEIGEWAGSGKVIDALSTGVPVLCRRRAAREEQLGADYPLFYSNREELIACAVRFAEDPTFRAQVQDWVRRRAAHFAPEVVAVRMELEVRRLIGNAR